MKPGWPAAQARPAAPHDNPPSDAKIALGRRLFYDADLSRDGAMSCATCHQQKHAFAEASRTHAGVNGGQGRRNVMALANIGWFTSLTWGDPTVTALEDQVKMPITGEHPVEMGMKGMETALVERLNFNRCYPKLFAAAFPETIKGGEPEVSMRTVSLAIAAFERELTSYNAPYDRLRRGESITLTEAQKRGEAVFFGRSCASCHAGALFSDADAADPRAAFHNIGDASPSDLGLEEITHDPADRWKFRTPSLRNATLTAPYLHDGSAATLNEAIRAHERPGAGRDPRLSANPLSVGDAADVIAFLATLTDENFVKDPRLSLPPRCNPDAPLHNNN